MNGEPITGAGTVKEANEEGGEAPEGFKEMDNAAVKAELV